MHVILLQIDLTKYLIFPNNFHDFHSVEITDILSYYFDKRFRETNVSLKKLLKCRVDFTKYFSCEWKRMSCFSTLCVCTVWKNGKFSLTQNIFRQINSLVTYLFSKTVTFTKFLPKLRERIPVISTHTVLCHLFPSNQFRKNVNFTEILQQNRECGAALEPRKSFHEINSNPK